MTLTQIETIAQGIIEHFSFTGAGYCEVPSVSQPGTMHRVYFNDKFYATSCDCKGGRFDCGHKVAVDRHFDARRDYLRECEKIAVEDIHDEEDKYPTLDSCDTCGAFVKKGFTTCARCLGY